MRNTTASIFAGLILACATSVACTSGQPVAPEAVGSTSSALLDADGTIETLRINSGPFAGGYMMAPAGKMNWYFTNIGLIPHITPTTAAHVKSYMQLYISKLTASKNIQDVVAPSGNWAATTGYTTVAADSDDAYAATFLTLAYQYYLAVATDRTWLRSIVPTLKDLAYANLVVPQKASGLVQVFQTGSANGSSTIGYLMDNCEDYRGLKDFASLLTAIGDTDTNYYDTHAEQIATGVHSLYSTPQSAFLPSDAHTSVGTSFYPDLTSQVFPLTLQVPDQATVAQYAHFTSAYNYMASHATRWWDGSYDVYPWGILGLAAGAMTPVDCTHAKMMRTTIENKAPAYRTINELGWHLQITDQCGP